MPKTLREWPSPGETYDAPEDEAEQLVYAGWAEYADPGEDDPEDPELEDELARLNSAQVGLDDGDDFDSDDFDSDFQEPDPEPRQKPVKKPTAANNKETWLKYARYMGYAGDDTITKSQLVARYGK